VKNSLDFFFDGGKIVLNIKAVDVKKGGEYGKDFAEGRSKEAEGIYVLC